MKAPDFRYERPETLDAVLALLGDESVDAAPLAGGQSLVPMMNFRMAGPDVLVDLSGISDLSGIRLTEDELVIGAMTSYRELEASAAIAEHAPLMARTIPYIAHPAIRNRGTLGGSVALADPAAEMPAILLALGGTVELRSATHTRNVAADDFFLGVYETAREENELVTAIRIPRNSGQKFGFHEIARRHGDYAMAGCALAASGDLSVVRVAFFAVAGSAIRVPDAEKSLAAGDIEAAIAALASVDLEGDLNASPETKRHLAGVAMKRAWGEIAP